jgi:hypothetical protein
VVARCCVWLAHLLPVCRNWWAPWNASR